MDFGSELQHAGIHETKGNPETQQYTLGRPKAQRGELVSGVRTDKRFHAGKGMGSRPSDAMQTKGLDSMPSFCVSRFLIKTSSKDEIENRVHFD